jgi:hypothetical protein
MPATTQASPAIESFRALAAAKTPIERARQALFAMCAIADEWPRRDDFNQKDFEAAYQEARSAHDKAEAAWMKAASDLPKGALPIAEPGFSLDLDECEAALAALEAQSSPLDALRAAESIAYAELEAARSRLKDAERDFWKARSAVIEAERAQEAPLDPRD